jgi:hypothetical protein
MKSITQPGREHPWIVEVKSSNGHGVIFEQAVIGHIDDRR